jgi:predicted PurR-regulated permease PerM
MWALGLPTPVLWGVMAALLNFIPFAGATVGAMVVFLVALLQFDLSYACLAPAIYVFVNVIESYWVTPALLGKSMSLNPVVILLSITLWGWMWGIGGVFMAVPLLVVLKIICDNVETLTPLGRMMES